MWKQPSNLLHLNFNVVLVFLWDNHSLKKQRFARGGGCLARNCITMLTQGGTPCPPCLFYRVPNTFPESNSMIFPWFSMTLASFFHDRHAKTMTNFNTDKTHYCALNVVSLYLLIATYNTHNKSWKSYNSLNNVLVLDGMRRAPTPFSMIFPYYDIDILKFHDFSMIRDENRLLQKNLKSA